jgi:hypothetical protein
VLTVAAGVTAVVRNLSIKGGQATFGGGIFNRGTLTLRDSNVTGNNATTQDATGLSGGGGIWNNFDGTVALKGCRVTGNTATSRARGQSRGGGIDNEGTMTLEDSVVSGNSAAWGGGIWNSETLTLKAGTVVGGDRAADANRAGDGGSGNGIANIGALTMESGSSVQGNRGNTSAGGIITFVPSSTVTLQAGSTVTRNRADEFGAGGIEELEGTVTLADRDIVFDNTPNNCRPRGAVPNCVN